ncbi:uncharacterized protein LOC135123839 [Zophobas morio]|uniref:uncharacterized protein LOC135123839 n=1 Tax=Zophobas morio TaxID=2755281 RepID=UPI003083623F
MERRKIGILQMRKNLLPNTSTFGRSQIPGSCIGLATELEEADDKVEKARSALWQCRRVVGRSWGLNLKIVLWIYAAIVRPMLCYGTLVWWLTARQKTTVLQLEHVQRMASLSVTGAMRTTPTGAMETLLCLAPLNLYIEEAAMWTSLRLHSLGVWNKQGRITKHTRILTQAFNRIPLLRMGCDRMGTKLIYEKTLLALNSCIRSGLVWECRQTLSGNEGNERADETAKDKLRKLIGFLTGHYQFNKHLHTIGVVTDPICRGYNEEQETAEYILCECPALASYRESILRNI